VFGQLRYCLPYWWAVQDGIPGSPTSPFLWFVCSALTMGFRWAMFCQFLWLTQFLTLVGVESDFDAGHQFLSQLLGTIA